MTDIEKRVRDYARMYSEEQDPHKREDICGDVGMLLSDLDDVDTVRYGQLYLCLIHPQTPVRPDRIGDARRRMAQTNYRDVEDHT